ncbi:hypothetical protein NBRC116584_31880 [Hydrogenophaga sp. 5NK40-0174]
MTAIQTKKGRRTCPGGPKPYILSGEQFTHAIQANELLQVLRDTDNLQRPVVSMQMTPEIKQGRYRRGIEILQGACVHHDPPSLNAICGKPELLHGSRHRLDGQLGRQFQA